ncbi:hypothetical protein Hdeb2414_s0006g00193091 [Helianthus debilis subsp. tardiflorus]
MDWCGVCHSVVVLWEVFGKVDFFVVVVVVCGRGWQLARFVAVRDDFLGLWDVILVGV